MRHKILGFGPRVQRIPWRRKWQPTAVFLPGESHGQRILVGYSPRGHKQLDMTEYTHTHTPPIPCQILISWGIQLQQVCQPHADLFLPSTLFPLLWPPARSSLMTCFSFTRNEWVELQTPALGCALTLHLALGGPVKEYSHPAFGKPVKRLWKLVVVGVPLCLYQVSSLWDIRSGMLQKQRYVEDSMYGNTNLSRECRESSST